MSRSSRRQIARWARATVLFASLLSVSLAAAAQESDPQFDPAVSCPAFGPNVGPRLLIDEAHRNLHTASGRYQAFAAVAAHDGFRVEPSAASFGSESPPTGALLVIANARGATTDDAFSAAEIERIRTWVEGGGALFLIADHAPFGSAAKSLAAAFGVAMIDGHVRDEAHAARELPGPYFLEFTRENALLGDHPILRGRSASEVISRGVTFGGQALRADGAGATVLLRLGPAAEAVADPNTVGSKVEPVGGLAQAVALEAGRGRVVIVGEAGLFGAQVISGEAAKAAGLAQDLRFGMNHPGTDDRQLLLNVLHWLARLL